MGQLEKIQSTIKEEMRVFDEYFKNSMKTDIPLLTLIINHILRRKGKRMRPMFVFLSAKVNGQVTQATYTAAALIELLHTATLIHDDVVDESYERRGFFSVYALWKSKIAVLLGDYLLSKGLLLSVSEKKFDLLEIVSNAVREMAEGELLQLEKARKLNITENVYFEIIRKKTATLIASCMASGAKSAGADDEQVKKMWKFGEYVGISFQIKDDLFDYQKKNSVGKPVGNDIQEKKMTLPLIHALEKASKKEKRKILSILRKKNKQNKDIAFVVDFVTKNGGIEYAEQKMLEYRQKAIDMLDDTQDTEAKQALIQLVIYTTTRKK